MPELLESVRKYVAENIGAFHQQKLENLKKLKLHTVLKKKNPYLFRTKSIQTPEEMVRSLLDAFQSSTEETVFGAWLEGLAIFVNEQVYGGWKSGIEGIDLEFNRDGTRYIVTIKSGPNWGNSSQLNRMKEEFKKAKRILGTSNSRMNIVAVNGCCYGKDNTPDKGDYFKYCGQAFWEFISGSSDLYTEIIEPLGLEAEKRNSEYSESYSCCVTLFAHEFTESFCTEEGRIDWEKLVRFNSQKENA